MGGNFPSSWGKKALDRAVREIYFWFTAYVLVCSGLRFYPGMVDLARSIGKEFGEGRAYLMQENIGMVLILLGVAFILHSIQIIIELVKFKEKYREIVPSSNPARLTTKELFLFIVYVVIAIFSVGVVFVRVVITGEPIYSSYFYYYLAVLLSFFMSGVIAGIFKLLPLLRLYFR